MWVIKSHLWSCSCGAYLRECAMILMFSMDTAPKILWQSEYSLSKYGNFRVSILNVQSDFCSLATVYQQLTSIYLYTCRHGCVFVVQWRSWPAGLTGPLNLKGFWMAASILQKSFDTCPTNKIPWNICSFVRLFLDSGIYHCKNCEEQRNRLSFEDSKKGLCQWQTST